MTSKEEVARLSWDSSFFGKECGSVELTTEDSLTDELLKSFTQYDFVKLVNENNLSSINTWIGEQTTAYLTDMNVIFSYDLARQPQQVRKQSFSAVCQPLDADNVQELTAVKEMAKSSFTHTRFFNDKKFSREQVEKMYENWVGNAIADSSKELSVLKEAGVVVGFIVLKKEEAAKQLTIELIAVKEGSRGRGYGSQLMDFSKETAEKNELKRIIVGTQIDNLQGMNLYIKNGFFVSKKRSIYHLWHA